MAFRELTERARRPVLDALRRIIRPLGVDVVRYEPERSVARRRQALLERLGVEIVLDVGANVGQYARSLRAGGYHKRIVSFEPLSEAFSALTKAARGDPLWTCLNVALGNRDGEIDLNIAGNSYSSSVLPMSGLHVASAPDSAYRGTERVALRRLDSIEQPEVREMAPVYLKLDVQGFEKAVLEGAPRTLSRVVALESELSLARLYEGQALFPEMIELIAASGFQLVSVEPGFADPGTGQLLQVDGIFTRTSPPPVHAPTDGAR